MQDWIMGHQGALRAAVFFGALALLLVLERRWPRRSGDLQRQLRWPANLGLTLANSALVFVLPFAAMGAAILADAKQWGLLNQLALTDWIRLPLAWVVLDCAIYWQHRALHEVRWLWPLHRVHHSDIEFDTTSGVRFHPAEIALSMLYKCGVVLALGAPPLAVLLLEITLNGFALFNHANLRLAPRLDRGLRRLLVTPDMHRVHHSIYREETDSNYGSTLSAWDHCFGSYRAQPRDGHQAMRIGIPEFRVAEEQNFPRLLLQPLRRP